MLNRSGNSHGLTTAKETPWSPSNATPSSRHAYDHRGVHYDPTRGLIVEGSAKPSLPITPHARRSNNSSWPTNWGYVSSTKREIARTPDQTRRHSSVQGQVNKQLLLPTRVVFDASHKVESPYLHAWPCHTRGFPSPHLIAIHVSLSASSFRN